VAQRREAVFILAEVQLADDAGLIELPGVGGLGLQVGRKGVCRGAWHLTLDSEDLQAIAPRVVLAERPHLARKTVA